jgi:hypothetical protein
LQTPSSTSLAVLASHNFELVRADGHYLTVKELAGADVDGLKTAVELMLPNAEEGRDQHSI